MTSLLCGWRNPHLLRSLQLSCRSNVADNEIRSVNSQARVSASRGAALALMSRILHQCDVDTMICYGTSWLAITSEIILMAYESESMRRLAADNLNLILRLCSQVPEIARDISSEHISLVIKQLLTCNIPDSVSCLKGLKAIVKYIPAPCGEFKGKLVKFLIPRMLSDNTTLQDAAIGCWCYIPIIGGGGTNRKDHVMQWERQLNGVLDALDYATNRFIDDLFSNQINEPVDPALKSISLPFPSIQKIEPEQSKALLLRFTILCKCFSQMMKCRRFNAPVKIPFDRIFSIVQSCCSVLPKTFGFTTEGRMRARHLVHFHRCNLQMFQSLMTSCSNYLVQQASAVNRVLANLLDIWKRPPPDIAAPEDCHVIRTDVYDTAALWVETCGWKSRFLSGDVHLVNVFLSHWQADVLLNEEILKLGENEISKGGRKKRKKVQPNITKEKKQFSHKKNSNLRSSALKVARLSLYSHGSGLSILVHKTLQETVMKIILNSMKRPTHPYNQCDVSRKELYHLLLALTVSPNPAWPSPLHFALSVFQRLSATEKNLSIRTFCVESSTTLSLIVRPRAPSLQRASINYNDECVRSYKESTHPSLDAVHSREIKLQDDYQVIKVNAQTSTDDLPFTNDDQSEMDDDGLGDDEENMEEQSEDDVLIEDDDVTSGILEDGETFENVKNGDEIASDVEDENNLEDNEDDAVFEKVEEELATSGSESDELSESIPDETGINKRKINEDTCNETKRIKFNEPSPAEETITEREDSIEIQTNDSEKKSSSNEEESMSITLMLADFVNAKADQSNESDVSST